MIECFRLGTVLLDINAATALVQDRKPNARVYVPWAERFIIRGDVTINRRYARRNKLKSTPAIVVDLFGQRMVIDGWHRLHRAYLKNRKFYPAHLLTHQEVLSIARNSLLYSKRT